MENHSCGFVVSVRMGRDIEDVKYFCDHELLDGYSGELTPFRDFFSEDTLCDMVDLLDSDEDSTNYRHVTSKDDSNRFLESIVMDFVYTFGRKSVDGDIAISTMKSSSFDLVHEHEEYDEESWE